MRPILSLGISLVFAVGLGHGGGEKGKAGKDKPRHMDEHVAVKPADLKWGPAPPGLPAGGQIAVLVGDPSKAGAPYVIRAKVPDGYKVPPHRHPHAENVTVLQGTLIIGRGKMIDAKHEATLPVGSFMHMPKEMPHYAIAKGEQILQIHGIGPFDISYVNPSDDPRNKK